MRNGSDNGVVLEQDATASENRHLREALKLAALRADGIAEDAERISRHIRDLLDSIENISFDKS